MTKIYGLFGSMTGKLADTVMSVRNGQQLARKYQPVVYNPSTPAQVANRAKLKLLSQLSAVVAQYIAIPREGAVSSRNLFTRVNFPLADFSNNNASINLASIKLTKSVVGMPPVIANAGESDLNVQLSESPGNVNRVVYVFLQKIGDNTLVPKSSVVTSAPGNYNTFPVVYPSKAENLVILAYGVRDKSESARVVFENLDVPLAERVAKIIVSNVLGSNDIVVTETRGIEYTPA